MAGGEDTPPQDQEQGSWTYRSDTGAVDAVGAGGPAATPAPGDETVEWTASEFIVHEKSPMWYVLLAAIAIIVAGLLYFATHDFITVGVVIILCAVMGVAAARKPRIITYRVDRGGITAGRQFHPYGAFKSFAVVDEGPFSSITLLPLKRFSLPVSLYFSPEDEDRVMKVLASHLPVEPGELDLMEQLMRHLHF